MSIVALLAIPAQIGLPTLLVREVARFHLREDWARLKGILLRATQIAVTISAVVVAVAIVVVWAIPNDRIGGATLFWALALVPLVALSDIRGGALRGLQKVILGQLPELALLPSLLLLFVVVAASYGRLTPQAVMGLHALAASLSFLAGSFLLMRALPRQVKHAAPIYDTQVWFKSAMSLSLVLGIQVISAQVAIVMLGVLSGQKEVGIYRVATQGAGLVAFTLNAVGITLAPHISRLHHAGDMAKLQAIVTLTARLILIGTLPVALVLVLFGREILSIVFGAEYASGYYALSIICVGQVVHAVVGSAGFLLNMTGHERDTTVAVGVGLCINVTLNLLLIPYFGIEGAAVATATTYLVTSLMLWRAVRVRLGINSCGLGSRVLPQP